jgi:fluoride exporter
MIAMVLVAVAGGFGAVSRFVLDGFIRSRSRVAFPLGTMIINVTGALLLGLVSGLVLRGALLADWRVVGGIGFLGGYTTFSTASFETVRLLQERRLVAALLNGLGMLVLGCAAAALGLFLGTANFA